MLLDCCYSGFGAKARGEMAPDGRIFGLWKEKARAVITAGSEKQRSWELAKEAFFSAALLRGLGESLPADTNQDGIVTDEELGDYAYREVKKATGDKQTPIFFRGVKGDDVGQFLFVRLAD